MFIGPGSSLTAENADGPGPGPKTERNQNPAEETTQAHPSEPLCDTYFLLANLKPPSPGTPGSPPHTPNDGALHQSSLRGPTGRRRADSAPGAIISTVALDGSLRSPPAGPRNYLPVIAPPAPPPPAACSVLPPVAYCYWPLAVWPPPPPLPPGPGRQGQPLTQPGGSLVSPLPCLRPACVWSLFLAALCAHVVDPWFRERSAGQRRALLLLGPGPPSIAAAAAHARAPADRVARGQGAWRRCSACACLPLPVRLRDDGLTEGNGMPCPEP